MVDKLVWNNYTTSYDNSQILVLDVNFSQLWIHTKCVIVEQEIVTNKIQQL